MDTPTPLPVACTLSAEALRCHADELLPGLVNRAASTQWLDDGLALTFAPTHDTLAHVADVVNRERVCCAFLTFTLEVPAGSQPYRLAMRGPEGTVAFLQRLMQSASHTHHADATS
jgi:hypothetical protein